MATHLHTLLVKPTRASRGHASLASRASHPTPSSCELHAQLVHELRVPHAARGARTSSAWASFARFASSACHAELVRAPRPARVARFASLAWTPSSYEPGVLRTPSSHELRVGSRSGWGPRYFGAHTLVGSRLYFVAPSVVGGYVGTLPRLLRSPPFGLSALRGGYFVNAPLVRTASLREAHHLLLADHALRACSAGAEGGGLRFASLAPILLFYGFSVVVLRTTTENPVMWASPTLGAGFTLLRRVLVVGWGASHPTLLLFLGGPGGRAPWWVAKPPTSGLRPDNPHHARVVCFADHPRFVVSWGTSSPRPPKGGTPSGCFLFWVGVMGASHPSNVVHEPSARVGRSSGLLRSPLELRSW